MQNEIDDCVVGVPEGRESCAYLTKRKLTFPPYARPVLAIAVRDYPVHRPPPFSMRDLGDSKTPLLRITASLVWSPTLLFRMRSGADMVFDEVDTSSFHRSESASIIVVKTPFRFRIGILGFVDIIAVDFGGVL